MKFKKIGVFLFMLFMLFMFFGSVSAENKYVKVVLIGNLKGGKTSVFKRLSNQNFDPNERQGDQLACNRRMINDGDDVLTLEIWDTPGLKDYYNSVIELTRHVNFVFIVHDLSQVYDERNRAYLNKIYKDVHDRIAADGEILFIGSKYDLRHSNIDNSSLQADLIERVARHVPCSYVITSAKDNTGISQLINFILENSRKMNLLGESIDIGSIVNLQASKRGCC